MRPALVASLLLAPAAYASPSAVAPLAREAQSVFRAARAECAAPGPRLAALVAEVFDPPSFGRAVIDGWERHTDLERGVFASLADRVIGEEQRAAARRHLCRPGTIVKAWLQDDPEVWIKFRAAGEDECTSLRFEKTAAAWRYRGEWFCGVTIPFARTWKAAHGNGDFDAAIDHLRTELARRASP